jgi:hypothetical protein
VLVVVYTCHLVGCFWYMIGTLEPEIGPDGALIERWIDRQWGAATVAAGNVTLSEGYITSFYWAISECASRNMHEFDWRATGAHWRALARSRRNWRAPGRGGIGIFFETFSAIAATRCSVR